MKRSKNAKHICTDIEQLREAFNNVSIFGAEVNRFIAQALLFLAERAVTNAAPRVRKPSAWNAFFGKGMKAGKSPAQIAFEWNSRPKLKKVG